MPRYAKWITFAAVLGLVLFMAHRLDLVAAIRAMHGG
jgi:hypothetical protein